MPMSRPRIRHISASERAQEVRAVEADPPGRHRAVRQEPHHRERGHRLSRPALADHPEHLARAHRHRHVAEDGQVVDETESPSTARRLIPGLARPEEEAGRVGRGDGRREVRGSSRRRPRPPRRRGRPRRRRAIVPGPIAGRSMRRSWPGFGALKSTPRAAGGPDARRRCARRSRACASVPWIDSSPRQMPPRHHRRLADVGRAERGDDRRRARGVARGPPRPGAARVEHARRRRGGRSGSRAARAPRSPPPRRCRRPGAASSRRRRGCPRSTRGASRSIVRSKRERAERRPDDAAGEGDLRRSRRRAGRRRAGPASRTARAITGWPVEPVERARRRRPPRGRAGRAGRSPRRSAAAGRRARRRWRARPPARGRQSAGTVKERAALGGDEVDDLLHQRVAGMRSRRRGAPAPAGCPRPRTSRRRRRAGR